MKLTILLSMLVSANLAMAQVNPVGPFSGDLQEDFETLPGGAYPSRPVFDDTSEMISAGGAMITAQSWEFTCTIVPFKGLYQAGSAVGSIRYEFTRDVKAFGGYFGTNADIVGPDGTAYFYSASGSLIGDAIIEISPDCGWRWNGWESDEAVAAIEIEGAIRGGAFVQMDAMELTFCSGSRCRADIDGDGSLSLFDFLAFQNAFDAGDLVADFDGDGSLTIFDFLEFQNDFSECCG